MVAATEATGTLPAALRAGLTEVTAAVAITEASLRVKFMRVATEVSTVVVIAADVSSEKTVITRFTVTNGITERTGTETTSRSSRTPQSSSAAEVTTKSNTTRASIMASPARTTEQATDGETGAVIAVKAVQRANQRGNLRRLVPVAEMSD
jgi:hypothetical protein